MEGCGLAALTAGCCQRLSDRWLLNKLSARLVTLSYLLAVSRVGPLENWVASALHGGVAGLGNAWGCENVPRIRSLVLPI